jgi:hypothetical protein
MICYIILKMSTINYFYVQIKYKSLYLRGKY